MESTKLQKLIADKNERRERDTLRTAESIIDQIAIEQTRIKDAQKRIGELREELKALNVDTLDATELLGE